MADGGECEFTGGNGAGILNNCGTICMGIKGHNQPEGFNETPEGFRQTLTDFATYVTDYFRTRKFLGVEHWKLLCKL